MVDWQKRVREEEKELGKKLEKLRVFAAGDAFPAIKEEDKRLLLEQLQAMRWYHAILTARISRF